MTQPFYFVTDIETNGPMPSLHSMLSFATVVVDHTGAQLDAFEGTLTPRPDRTQDPNTMAWWTNNPQAWAAATDDPQPPEQVMSAFVAWARGFEGDRYITARPMVFDGAFLDEYLYRFAGTRLMAQPWVKDPPFHGAGIDISSLMSGVLGQENRDSSNRRIPVEWLGNIGHSHRAIDDARGYAHLVGRLLQAADDPDAKACMLAELTKT